MQVFYQTTGVFQLQMDINEAHEKCEHIGNAALHTPLKTINTEATGVLISCEGCALAKAKNKAIPNTLG